MQELVRAPAFLFPMLFFLSTPLAAYQKRMPQQQVFLYERICHEGLLTRQFPRDTEEG